MLKKTIFLLLLFVSIGFGKAIAQTGNNCDPIVVNQAVQDFISQGFDCLEGAGPFACVGDAVDYIFANCPPVVDTTGGNPCDPAVVNQLIDELIVSGFECLDGAGPFACVDDVFNYAFENCPPVEDTTLCDPCNPAVVEQLIDDLIAEGFDCLEGAGPFDCVDDVLDFAFENCPPVIDTTGGGFCDPLVVNQLVADLVAQGFDCLEGAGPFACVTDVFSYAFENCPPLIDTTGGDPCDSAVVNQLIEILIGEGFDCLEGAGPFACADDVFEFAFENCPPVIDTTECNPCDSAVVNELVADLIAEGADCLVGAGPFDCVFDVFDFVMGNCPFVEDTTGGDLCDSLIVDQLVADLIADGFDCLEGAGPFVCVDEVLEFAFENCAPVDTTGGDCDTAAVNQAITDLIAQGYDCLEGAGPFACVHDVLCYALENCPLPTDTTWVELPICLQNIPASVNTFQEFLQYIAANCDSTVVVDIPACWLSAPTFATDEEFFAWIFENCPDTDSLLIGEENRLMQTYFSPTTTRVKNIAGGLTGIFISPNPTASDVEISLAEGQIGRVELIDLTGRQVFTQQYEGVSRAQISLDKMPAGVYMARIADAQGRVATMKVVKQ